MIIDHFHIRPISFDPNQTTLQGALDVVLIIAHQGDCDHSVLPYILKVHLGSRDIEFAVQTR